MNTGRDPRRPGDARGSRMPPPPPPRGGRLPPPPEPEVPVRERVAREVAAEVPISSRERIAWELPRERIERERARDVIGRPPPSRPAPPRAPVARPPAASPTAARSTPVRAARPGDRPPRGRPSNRALLRQALSSPGALRQGFLLREVLGPPVSLRADPDDRRG